MHHQKITHRSRSIVVKSVITLFYLIVFMAEKTTAAIGYGFPINNEIRPTIGLIECGDPTGSGRTLGARGRPASHPFSECVLAEIFIIIVVDNLSTWLVPTDFEPGWKILRTFWKRISILTFRYDRLCVLSV